MTTTNQYTQGFEDAYNQLEYNGDYAPSAYARGWLDGCIQFEDDNNRAPCRIRRPETTAIMATGHTLLETTRNR